MGEHKIKEAFDALMWENKICFHDTTTVWDTRCCLLISISERRVYSDFRKTRNDSWKKFNKIVSDNKSQAIILQFADIQ